MVSARHTYRSPLSEDLPAVTLVADCMCQGLRFVGGLNQVHE